MFRGIGSVSVWICLTLSAAYGQSDRGTITGTIADSSGAVVAAAPVQAKNVQTGAVYQGRKFSRRRATTLWRNSDRHV